MNKSQQPPEAPEPVQVEIAGRTYTLRGNRDAGAVRQLAAMVDKRMNAIAAQTRSADTTRVAILAALNIADELQKAQSKTTTGHGQRKASSCRHDERDQRLCRVLDAALAG